ncbi:hypothetical protein ES703_124018 [subsurface metagenome]
MDVNQNAVIKTEATADAVNYITIKNAATGSGPQAKAEGTGTDIDFIIKTKGVGKFQVLDGNDKKIIEFHTIANFSTKYRLLPGCYLLVLDSE